MDSILEIDRVTKAYPNFRLGPVSLKIPYGKIVGLIGENGAGKTTLISLILNQIERDGGSIRIFGRDSQKEELRCKRDIGFAVDECCFHPSLTPKNLDSVMRGIYPQWSSRQFFELLSRLKVSPSRTIRQMSKGMKVKLTLAAALSHHPVLLILDEITSGLDPVVRSDVLAVLREFVAQGRTSVFFSTHITSDLEKTADFVAFLHQGKLIFYESLKNLKENYILIQCSEEAFRQIGCRNRIASLCRNGVYQVLLRNSADSGAVPGQRRVPTLDDIMLLYIKGDVMP